MTKKLKKNYTREKERKERKERKAEKTNPFKKAVLKRDFVFVSRGVSLGVWEYKENRRKHVHGATVKSEKAFLYRISVKVR